MRSIARRFVPKSDLKRELERLVLESKIQAGVLLSLVGSLSNAALRAAGGSAVLKLEGPLEIVAGTGTFASDGTMHVHLCVADSTGRVQGGHLMPGCTILTTAEVVIGDLSSELHFSRQLDETTGHLEFVVRNLAN